MPLYEYECFVCRHRFERIHRVDAEPVTTCPACGGQVRRLLGVPALQFKGSGWYITDYGSGRSAGSTANGHDGGTGEKASGDGGNGSPSSSSSSSGSDAD
ncbi:MAG TPA: FmdB family zinc ribbon protein [Methylomirabilota bacterium]|nr:FmdB family zinc ribbon protein [Methylomirabilota bacterium]